METWAGITELLRRSARGDAQAREQLFESLYQDLHRIAERIFSGEPRDHTLQPTALLHEAFVKLSTGAAVEYQDRVHFLAVASRQMRRILVDQARKRRAQKRDADATLTLLALSPGLGRASVDLLDINAALDELERLDERTARVVDLRFFAGLTEEETAQAMGVSPATVRSDWRFARGWLTDRLEAGRK